MSREEHRIYFSSSFCLESSGHFILNLPYTLDLQGKWKCAIKDIYIFGAKEKLPQFIYVLGDFCETSILQGQEVPILNKVYFNNNEYYSFADPLYIPLKQKQLYQLELAFTDRDLKTIHFDKNFLIECTLHFYKNE